MVKPNKNSGSWKCRQVQRWDLLIVLFSGFSSFMIMSLLTVLSMLIIPQVTASIIKAPPVDYNEEIVEFPIETDETCVTQECFEAASQINAKMDYRMNPCDNFYKFACGKFLNTTVIPNDKYQMDTFIIVEEKLSEQLKTVIEAESEINEPKFFGLVKKLYKSCMNTDAIETRGLEPLHKMLKRLGGWPVLKGSRSKDNNFDWMDVTKNLDKIGYDANFPFTVAIDIDLSNGTRYVIVVMYQQKHNFSITRPVSQAAVYPPRDYLMKGFNDAFVQDYYSYMVDVAVILGAQKERATSELRETLLFQIQLADITRPQEELRNATRLYNPTSLSDLTSRYPIMPWRRYFNDKMASGIKLQDNEKIVVEVPGYVNDVLKLLAITPNRVLVNYIVWGFIRDSIQYLNDLVRKRKLNFLTAMTGQVEFPSRKDQCIRIVSYLPPIVGAMYVRKYFDEEAKKRATEMVMGIRRQFDETLKKVEWLDEETRKRTLEKAAAMTNHIGYPDELLDDAELQRIYQSLELSDDMYFENTLNLTLFETKYLREKLHKPVIKNEWIDHAESALVNAFYRTEENSIGIPAGILQDLFFNVARPRYMNYAGIGFIIAHEIIHGFDDRGRQFDKSGNLFDWWSSSTKKQYEERAKCIIEQYGNYTVDEVGFNLNGINTQSENIADNGGIKLAYNAYVNWSTTKGPEKKLPGLPYTPKQMFWISTATTWCSLYRPKFLAQALTEDSHSSAEFRIVGPFSNAPEFSQDFNCPVGSNMNPEKKCTVW